MQQYKTLNKVLKEDDALNTMKWVNRFMILIESSSLINDYLINGFETYPKFTELIGGLTIGSLIGTYILRRSLKKSYENSFT